LLNILRITLVCTSPLMHMIHKFDLLMELLSFCIFLLQLLNLLSKSLSVLSLISVLSSSPALLSSTYSSLLDWLSLVIFIWFKKILFPEFLFDSLFWVFPYLC
jgi:hypothetical protein